MKKVFLYAYDCQNLGDDLFVHAIAKRYPGVKFFIWSDAMNVETFRQIPNLKVINDDSKYVRCLKRIRPSLVSRRRAKAEQRCDAVVYIGGSLFIEYDNWETILTWWDYEAKNRNFYVIGANFGPYKTEAYREKLAEIFSKMKDVCFRDRYSLNMFRENYHVRYAPDILLGIDMPKRTDDRKRVFISVINCQDKSEGINQFSKFESQYLSLLLYLINAFASIGYRISLASFCQAEGDETAINKLINQLDDSIVQTCIDLVNYNGKNADDMLLTISNSDYVIASRFHAAILGFAAEKPVLPVVYSDKTIHVLNDLQFMGIVLDLRRLENVSLNKLIDEKEKQLLQHFDYYREKSYEQFAILDQQLHKE